VTLRVLDRLTVFCLAVGLAALGVVVALVVTTPFPPLVPLVVFGALIAFAESRGVLLTPTLETTAGFMLMMASIVVFHDSDALVGPVLVAICGGINPAHIRERAWRKTLFNCGNYALAALATALVYWSMPPWMLESPGSLVVVAVLAGLAFFVVVVTLLSTVITLSSDERFGLVFHELVFAHVQVFPFAVLGVFLGRLYIDVGAVIVPLFVVPIFVARETFASFLALKRSHDDTVRILIGALEAKDRYTAGHAERVAMFANYIGLELGLTPRRLERLRFAALMHDVGKLIVPNHLLNKPGRLTPEEFQRVQLHETVSVEILTRIDFLAPVAPSAVSEHTRFKPVADSSGQPIEPHIVAVADAFDAMTSTRSYRKALSQSTAFKELRENAGKQFHPRVVDALIAAIERRGEQYGAGFEHDAHEFEIEPPDAGLGSAGLGDLLEEDVSEAPESASS
jgi:HD-GYP domain-containing protein (c-di-GMP phosphodiesterase class II)